MRTLTMRLAQDANDYWRIRQFLREVLLLNDRRERSWPVHRFDYCRWHAYENIDEVRLEQVVYLWETMDGQIAGVLNPEVGSEVFVQIHPALRTPGLEEAMIAVAEERLARPGADGKRALCVSAHQGDDLRQEILIRRGYTRGEWPEYQRRRPLPAPFPDAPIPAGYTVRALGDVEELPARSRLSWDAFHADDPDGYDGDWGWYRNVKRAPLYRRDLDLVAVAPDGELAAFCTAWFDDVTRMGAFEPVGTAPAHRRRGLGKALLCEGLRRLQWLGATAVHVGSYDEPAHALYASVGFTAYELSEPWHKTLEAPGTGLKR